jgi:hypothetical protein
MDNLLKCKICFEDFNSESSLHRHLKKHSISKEEYYFKFFPRYDKMTGELISFKSKEHYFSTDFNSKENLRLWFDKSSKDTCVEYIKTFLSKRIEEKKMIYYPTQVELKSLYSPSLITIKKYIEDFNSFCSELGLLKKLPDDIEFSRNRKPVILIDTREQKILDVGSNYAYSKLSYGDYCLNLSLFSPTLYIERKSFMDFISTLSTGFDRFTREMERCQNDNSYLLVIVEKSLSKCLDFRNKCDIPNKLKITPEYVFHNVRYLLQNFKNIQFLFVKNHEEASILSKHLLTQENPHVNDLQFLYDTGEYNDILPR